MKKIAFVKNLSWILFFSMLIFTGCNSGSDKKEVKPASEKAPVTAENPFFKEYNTPFKVPPFKLIKEEHYMPAFEKGLKEAKDGILAIINNKEEPTFANTIVAMQKNGELLGKVSAVFFHLNGADTTPGLQKLSDKITPMLSKYRNFVNLNAELFKRIDTLYAKKDNLKLTSEEMTLLTDTWRGFVRSGAKLKPEEKAKIKAINEEMAVLALKFRKNLLHDTNGFKLFIDKKEDLEGLPATLVKTAAAAAKKDGQEGKWLFTLHKPSWIPFLQYSPKRELREKLYKGYINRCNNNDKYDNKKIIARIALLRLKKARIMGYKTHADFRLEINMSKEPANVYKLLNKLWTPALNMAKKERAAMQELMDKEGKKGET